ncbi:MAG: sugar transferase [Nanoarchaeota archaeon]
MKLKRIFDLFFSFILLLILFIPMLILAIIIKLDSKGPAFFKQERTGQAGKIFTVYKFRTMKYNTPQKPTNNLDNRDKYITRVGKFLRITSIDELPQLINILKGDMSFVGPRPVIPEEKKLNNIRKKLNVYSGKPGVTGLAQINGRDRVTPEKKAKIDAYYVHNRSLWLDLYIIGKTAVYILKRKGIIEKETPEPSTIEEQEKEVAASKEDVS